MKKNATIYDIGKALRLSPSTISRALNDHPRISSKTKQLVHKTALELGYQQNHLASSLRKGTSNIVGVIVPFMNHNFFSTIISGLEEVLAKNNLNIIITQSHEDLSKEIANLDVLLKAQVSGIIISFSRETQNIDHLNRLLEYDVPLIVFDRTPGYLNTNSVLLDDFTGAYQATEHLIHNGYARIAHFYGSKHLNIYQERLRGYEAALKANNIPLVPEYICSAGSAVAAGEKATIALLQLDHPPDALFSSSDYAALGAMKVLKKNHIAIPSEFGIVGFSNEPFTEYLTPSLTSVDQKPLTMGREIGNTFLRLLEDEKTQAREPRKLVVAPSLVIRESSQGKGQ